jgi:uncharacterized protein
VTAAKYDRLLDVLRGLERLVVAFSGGVDSTLLARAARDAVGDRALLVTADSETYPAGELAEARKVAALIGLRHQVVSTRELDNPDYARNPVNRCFFCKDELFRTLAPIAAAEDGAALVYGAIMDDVGDHRPGMEAAKQLGVRAPLIEAELWKAEIRELSRAFGLPTWDKPSFACLSSRFQYGDRITAEKLRQVDAAETIVRELGFRQFRVRHHDRLARLELAREETGRLWEDGRHDAIVRGLRKLGYLYVTVDLAGFHSGSANLVLKSRRQQAGDGPNNEAKNRGQQAADGASHEAKNRGSQAADGANNEAKNRGSQAADGASHEAEPRLSQATHDVTRASGSRK